MVITQVGLLAGFLEERRVKLEMLVMGFGLILYSGEPVEAYGGSSERPPPQRRAGLTAGHSWTQLDLASCCSASHPTSLPWSSSFPLSSPPLPASQQEMWLDCQPKPCNTAIPRRDKGHIRKETQEVSLAAELGRHSIPGRQALYLGRLLPQNLLS